MDNNGIINSQFNNYVKLEQNLKYKELYILINNIVSLLSELLQESEDIQPYINSMLNIQSSLKYTAPEIITNIEIDIYSVITNLDYKIKNSKKTYSAIYEIWNKYKSSRFYSVEL